MIWGTAGRAFLGFRSTADAFVYVFVRMGLPARSVGVLVAGMRRLGGTRLENPPVFKRLPLCKKDSIPLRKAFWSFGY
jgi:hypothetical protein